MFSAALASGQLGPLMSQFGLPAEAVDAANKGGECWCWWEQERGGCWGCWYCTQPLNVGCKDQLLSSSPSLRVLSLQADSCTDVYKEKAGGTGVPSKQSEV